MVEHLAVNEMVAGSSPASGAITFWYSVKEKFSKLLKSF